MHFSRSQSGFSFIEMIVYIGLFSLLALTISNSLLQSVRGFNQLRASRDINDSSIMIMERLSDDVKNSLSIDMANSTFGATPGRLTLNTINASGTPMVIEYYVSGNILRIKENSVDTGSLMISAARIEALVFYLINTGNTTGVKTELHLKSTRGIVSANDHFYNTTMLRGTY